MQPGLEDKQTSRNKNRKDRIEAVKQNKAKQKQATQTGKNAKSSDKAKIGSKVTKLTTNGKTQSKKSGKIQGKTTNKPQMKKKDVKTKNAKKDNNVKGQNDKK